MIRGWELNTTKTQSITWYVILFGIFSNLIPSFIIYLSTFWVLNRKIIKSGLHN